MKNYSNTGGVYFTSPDYSDSLEGVYTKTPSGYFELGSKKLFIGSSCQKGTDSGLWLKTPSKSKYVSSLRPQDRENTYYFDTYPEKAPHLLILKEDRLRIVRIGGANV